MITNCVTVTARDGRLDCYSKGRQTGLLQQGAADWTVTARGGRRITAAEMKYMRRTAGHTWADCKINTQVTKEIKIHNSAFGS